MSDDPLAGFRRKGEKATSTASRPTEGGDRSREYEAFNPKDNQRRGRLNIRRKGGMSHAPGYNFIIDICYDEDHYSGILLILSTMIVKIRGRNLKPIVDALLLGTCEFIQEFRDDIFDKPDDATAPFVEAIEIVTGRESEETRVQT
jgi:hypothetical protein